MKRDTLFAAPIQPPQPFVFDELVVEVFDDMVARSVPLYQEVQAATTRLALHFAQPGTTLYDLGCSTGTTLRSIGKALNEDSIALVGVDNSAAMIRACQRNLDQDGLHQVHLKVQDLATTDCSNASVVVLNYTLQFFPPEQRAELLKKIYAELVPGGVVLVSEKVRHLDEPLQTCLTELHHDFKRKNGYSDLEISQKRDAIEQVLIPLTAEENVELLKSAGFTSIAIFLKWYTFVSLIAIKER